jgi:hypothetical protein
MKTLDWSVETLGLDYNSTGLCNQTVRSAKCPFGKMSVRQKVRSAKRPSTKCPFGKMSFGKMSFGKVSFGKMSGHRNHLFKSE